MESVSFKKICWEMYEEEHGSDAQALSYESKDFKNYYYRQRRHFQHILEDLGLKQYIEGFLQAGSNEKYNIDKSDADFVKWILRLYTSDEFEKIIELNFDQRIMAKKLKTIEGFYMMFYYLCDDTKTLCDISAQLHKATHYLQNEIEELINRCSRLSVDMILKRIEDSLMDGSLPQQYIKSYLKAYENALIEEQEKWVDIYDLMLDQIRSESYTNKTPDELTNWAISEIETITLLNAPKSEWVLKYEELVQHYDDLCLFNTNIEELGRIENRINSLSHTLHIKAEIQDTTTVKYKCEMIGIKKIFIYADGDKFPITIDPHGNIEATLSNTLNFLKTKDIMTSILYAACTDYKECKKALKKLLIEYPYKTGKVGSLKKNRIFIKPILNSDDFVFGISQSANNCDALLDSYIQCNIVDLDIRSSKHIQISAHILQDNEDMKIKAIVDDPIFASLDYDFFALEVADHNNDTCVLIMPTVQFYGAFMPDIYYNFYGIVCGINGKHPIVFVDWYTL